jgi:hypothetical protein
MLNVKTPLNYNVLYILRHCILLVVPIASYGVAFYVGDALGFNSCFTLRG